MSSKLLEHLRGRQIAPILEESNEKTDPIALKIMTIIDHKLEEKEVYTKIKEASIKTAQRSNETLPGWSGSGESNTSSPTRISESEDLFSDRSRESITFSPARLSESEDPSLVPVQKTPFVSKLLRQLLNIKFFGKFHFFKYRAPTRNFNFILQCRQCSLIGPYFVVLSHMVLSHGTHASCKQCQWCKQSDLEEHIKKNTLKECYKKYLEKESIDDPSYPSVIITFYEMIECLAVKLGAFTSRNSRFNGEGKPKRESWFYDGIEPEVVVFRHRRPTAIKNLDKLNIYFKQAISAYYGNSRILEFMPQENRDPIEVDGQVNGASSITRQRIRKRRQSQWNNSNDSPINNRSNSSVRSESVPGTSTKRSSSNFGQTIDEFIENIPNDEMKINAKLKVQSVVLEFSKKAYEERVNCEHQ